LEAGVFIIKKAEDRKMVIPKGGHFKGCLLTRPNSHMDAKNFLFRTGYGTQAMFVTSTTVSGDYSVEGENLRCRDLHQ
jgi:hypothetical protein